MRRKHGLLLAGVAVLTLVFSHSALAEYRTEKNLKLEPGGRFYLVTKQPNEVGAVVAEEFGSLEAEERRGYVILSS